MFQSQKLAHDNKTNQSIHAEYGSKMHCSQYKNGQYNMTLPHEFKKASLQFEYIRAGMFISLFDFTSTQAMSSYVETEHTPLTFGATISGCCELHYNKIKGKNAIHKNVPQEMVARGNNLSGKFYIPAHSHFQMISLSISDIFIAEIIGGHEEYKDLQKQLIDKKETFQVIDKWALSPNMHYIASQLLNCPLQGKNRALFMESKALEILALQLEKLQDHPIATVPIKRYDIEKIHEARHLLFESMEEPPSILELAVKVGINDFKLKQGFKKIFNNTVYGTLREHRMETARIRLLEGDTTVTEVAASVGYTNISHFISAFRKQYTINPGQLLKNVEYRPTLSHSMLLGKIS